MTEAPLERDLKNDLTSGPGTTVSGLERPVPALAGPVSITANLVAAFLSFVSLVAASTIVVDFVPLPDEFAAVFVQIVPMDLLERTSAAFGVALLFLVIGIGFQLWQRRRRLASWWPLVVAFPLVGVLLVPDALARGEPIWIWATIGAAIAQAFCVHWLFVLAAVELMD
ncbi:MAG TPA: hypothetical protein VKA15_10345 [Isosphaeraceae bacterium]|nr:hypothetical protein [Isosphaeraceae bacterium]